MKRVKCHNLISSLLTEIKKTAKGGAAFTSRWLLWVGDLYKNSPVGDYFGSVIYINVLYSQIDKTVCREFAASYNVSCRNTFGIFSSNFTHFISFSPSHFSFVMVKQAQRNERQSQYGLYHILVCSDCSCCSARRKTPLLLFWNDICFKT